MSNKELSTDLPAAVHLGPVELMPGVNRTNAITKLYASGITIAALTGMSILQAYNLTEHLEIPRRAQGSLSGDLSFFTEIGVRLFDAWGPWAPFLLAGAYQAPLLCFALIVRFITPARVTSAPI
jgi:hypothetical protein